MKGVKVLSVNVFMSDQSLWRRKSSLSVRKSFKTLTKSYCWLRSWQNVQITSDCRHVPQILELFLRFGVPEKWEQLFCSTCVWGTCWTVFTSEWELSASLLLSWTLWVKRSSQSLCRGNTRAVNPWALTVRLLHLYIFIHTVCMYMYVYTV